MHKDVHAQLVGELQDLPEDEAAAIAGLAEFCRLSERIESKDAIAACLFILLGERT